MTDERTVTTGETAALLCSQESVAALLAEIDRLRARLEMVLEHPIDGIETRDATIRLQDAEIDRLTRERDEIAARLESAVDALTHKRPLMTTAKTVDDWRRIAEHLDFEWSECSRHLNKVAAQRDEARAEFQEADTLNRRIVDLLTRTANALRGDPPPLTLWSWHDLPEHAAALRAENHNLNWALGTDGYEQMATPEEQAEHEEAVRRTDEVLDRMAAAKAEHDAKYRDAERYRWLRANHVVETMNDGELCIHYACDFEHYNDPDASIDAALAQIEQERSEQAKEG